MVPNDFVFIRTKQIKGKPYAYLVENTWKKGRAKQEVKKYLGRVHNIDQAEPPKPSQASEEEIIHEIIAHELQNAKIDIRIDFEKRKITHNEKEIVLGLNGGYLCSHTLQDLLKALHIRNEVRPGTALAEAFSRAGLRIPHETFIRLYIFHHPQ